MTDKPKINDLVKVTSYTSDGTPFEIKGVYRMQGVDEDNIPYYVIGESLVYLHDIEKIAIIS